MNPIVERRNPRAVRAAQVWQILLGAAHQRRAVTAGELAEILGFENTDEVTASLTATLACIAGYCREHALPPLASLVVDQGVTTQGGTPMAAHDVNNLRQDRNAVFGYKWYRLYPVQIEDFDRFEGCVDDVVVTSRLSAAVSRLPTRT